MLAASECEALAEQQVGNEAVAEFSCRVETMRQVAEVWKTREFVFQHLRGRGGRRGVVHVYELAGP